MIRRHGEERPLIEWLIVQEKVLRLWIGEVVSAAPPDADFLRNLETHRAWLSSRIDELTGRLAAPTKAILQDLNSKRGLS